jgi:hypothetical protein
MKLFLFPIATVDHARMFSVFVRSPFRRLLCSLTLCVTASLTAAPARAQTVYRPLTFEHNRGHAPRQATWLGQSGSHRVRFEGNGATFLHPNENDTRAMAERPPIPVDNSRDRRSSHPVQTTRKSRGPGRKLAPVEGTTPTGRSLLSVPQISQN